MQKQFYAKIAKYQTQIAQRLDWKRCSFCVFILFADWIQGVYLMVNDWLKNESNAVVGVFLERQISFLL
jgi:hypothetical protein